ncbi:MAG TPA: glycosyltransferase family 1 protein [Longimicrobiales bacterium]|nr:glycosyltransferase family 1 protein [Longimicrobiales bacterium]
MTRQRVALFSRKPTPHVYSIEQVFDLIAERLPERFEPLKTVSSYRSKGVVPRALAVLEARRRQGDLNHVVGDVNYLAILLSRPKTVLTVHDCEFMERAGPLKRWIYRWLWLELPMRRAAVVVVPTRDVLKDLQRYTSVDPARVRVIPMPVDPVFTPSPVREDAREPVILQVGTRSNKNLERVIRALQGMPCTLVVLGALTPSQRALLEMCGVRYEERLALPREQVADAYREADVVVFASTKEGFGLPIVEAQASGRAVVAGDRPPLPEVAGEGACLVDPFDVSSIRAGIRRVVEDAAYRRRLVEEGLRNVARFEAGRIAEAHADLYDEVLASAAAR